MVKSDFFPPNFRNKARMSALIISIQHWTESPRQCNRKEK